MRFGALVDAGSDAAAMVRDAVGKRWKRRRTTGTVTGTWTGTGTGGGGDGDGDAAATAAANAETKREPSAFARDAKALTDAYGLAYMAAKNVIGPVSIVLFYYVIKRGVNLSAWLGPEVRSPHTGPHTTPSAW